MNDRLVCCFHERVPGLPDAAELITLWTRAWQSMGWETRLLTSADARRHPLFPGYRDHVSRFFSRNVGNYDHLCWLRWLAFDVIGGGVMTDYDVLPRCLVTQDVTFSDVPTIHERTRVPCMVSASPTAASALVTHILTTQPPGRGIHFSDMTCFQASPFPHDSLCVEFGHEGWEEAKSVHFSRHACKKWNVANKVHLRREQVIRTLFPT